MPINPPCIKIVTLYKYEGANELINCSVASNHAGGDFSYLFFGGNLYMYCI